MKRSLMYDKNQRLTDELIDCGEYSKARTIYSEMLRDSPDDPHLLALRGYTWFRMDKPEDALADFDAALALRPDAPNTLFMRAKCKELLNDLDGAIADYRQVIALAPATADAYSGIAMIYEYRGDLDGARREHRTALSLDSNLASSTRFFRKYGS